MKRFRSITFIICSVLVITGCALSICVVEQSENTIHQYASESNRHQFDHEVQSDFENEWFVFEQYSAEASSEQSAPSFCDDIPEIDETLFDDIPVAALYETEEMRAIYEQNVHQKRSVASLTKLVTAAVALKYSTPDTVYTVGTELSLVAWDSSVCGIKQGMQINMQDLITGMLMCSGNDAAYTIAVNIARGETDENLTDEEAVIYFSDLMNEFAHSLGMNNSNFILPDGYEADGQFSTAYDLAKIAEFAMDNTVISQIAGTAAKTLTIESGEIFEWRNTNFFLDESSSFYDWRVTGLKTGYTSAAGKCLICTFNINGKNYISIVLGCANDEQRYKYSRELIEYVEQQLNS